MRALWHCWRPGVEVVEVVGQFPGFACCGAKFHRAAATSAPYVSRAWISSYGGWSASGSSSSRVKEAFSTMPACFILGPGTGQIGRLSPLAYLGQPGSRGRPCRVGWRSWLRHSYQLGLRAAGPPGLFVPNIMQQVLLSHRFAELYLCRAWPPVLSSNSSRNLCRAWPPVLSSNSSRK